MAPSITKKRDYAVVTHRGKTRRSGAAQPSDDDDGDDDDDARSGRGKGRARNPADRPTAAHDR